MATIPQIPTTDSNRVTFRMDEAFIKRLKIACIKNNLTVQAACSKAVEKKLEELEARAAKKS